VNPLVIDASIAIERVVEEQGTAQALALPKTAKFIAPDLLVA
jgi:predicted nucleic acid-binding protein